MEYHKTGRKRDHSVTDEDYIVSKRPSNVDLEGEEGLFDAFQTQHRNYFPHHLIGLMYQLDLSVLCSHRKFMYRQKYPSLSLAFGDSEIDKFNNVVIRYKERSIHIRIENVDKYYIHNISYDKLFIKKRSFSINNYFDSFVKHLISKSDNLLDNIEYLVIYTNAELDLTEEKKLKQGQTRSFYPFKLDIINMEECDILKDFLFTNANMKGRVFYRFSQDKTLREDLLKQLKFLSAVQKEIQERKLSPGFKKLMKEEFLNKLVFAVNQPNRDELSSIIKIEIERNGEVQFDCTALHEEILRDVTAPEKHKKLEKFIDYIPEIMYEFNILMFFMYDMFLHKYIFSINSERKSHDISNDITVYYQDKVMCIKAYTAYSNIGYNHLFSSIKWNSFSINKHFTFFIEELKLDINYFILYTNVDLDLTEEKRLKNARSNDFYGLKFDNIDIQKNKYKILRDSSCINKNGLYQFSQEETTRKMILNLLKLPPSLQKEKGEGTLSNESENEIKMTYLDKLIFAVNQPSNEKLSSTFKEEINKSNKIPYNYEELREIALRWSESHEFGYITKGVMKKIFEDIKNNRFSSMKIQNKDINIEIKFAKSVAGGEGTPAFDQFLEFLIKEEKLEILKKQGINPANMSSILSGAGANSVKAFKDLFDLWFDGEGNKTQYLKTLEEKEINLANISSILSKSRVNGAKAFKDLYDLWFDGGGNKTRYLKTLEEKEIYLSKMSSILGGAGAQASKVFKDLYNLWFDGEGNKTRYLKTLEEKGINLANISSILNRTGAHAPRAFKDLYDLLFDIEGNKTQYLKSLEVEGVNLATISSILNGAGANAPKAFKDLHNLWFDGNGNKTLYLKNLEEEGIHLSNMSSILSGAGAKAPEAFIDLFDLWFDREGNKRHYLKALEEEGINIAHVSSILHKVGAKASKTFEDLYDLWFDRDGNKTQYLKAFEEEGINIANMSSILHGVGAKASKTFKDLYNLWFDGEGNKMQYLRTLEEEGINLASISSILGGAGANAPKTFKDLYDVWFDGEGIKTHYLKTLEQNGINLTNMSNILHGARADAAKSFKDLHNLWFDGEGNKTKYLKTLEEKGINLTYISSILGGAGANASKAFEDLYNLWFDGEGNKAQYLKAIEKEGINLANMSSILGGAGAKAPKAFRDLCDLWFDADGNKTQYLKILKEKCISLTTMCSILHGSRAKAAKAFKDLHDLWFDKEGNKTQYLKTLEEKRIMDLTAMSGILNGAGTKSAKAFKNLYDLWFDGEGNTMQYLQTLKKEKINLANMSSILGGAGAKAPKAFKDLYELWLDGEGNKTQYLKTLEEKGINLANISSILHRAGANAPKAFKELYNTFFDDQGNRNWHLKHFMDEKDGRKCFKLHNLSSMLSGAGTNAKDAFEKLHSVCFNSIGKRTELLDDFSNAGFKPSNLSCMLCGAGVHAASILKRLHGICFNEKREKTKLLDDFFKTGFRPCDLCHILSGAADSLEEFHNFCFVGETKRYLNHFINEKEGFTLVNLSRILHGARANICSALKDFHDVCFDETGNTTQLINDFCNAGFKPHDLSNILFLAGNNAASIFKSFNKIYFNKDYLNHFLAEEELFTPKNISKILAAVGVNICSIFKKLHDLCFDKAGNKTNYLNNHIQNNQCELIDILHKKVRADPSTFLDDMLFQQQNTSRVEKKCL